MIRSLCKIFVAVLFDIAGVLFLEPVRDYLIIDQRENEFLVVRGIDCISDYVRTLEQVRIEPGE